MPVVARKPLRSRKKNGIEYVLQIELTERCGADRGNMSRFLRNNRDNIEHITFPNSKDVYYNYKQAYLLWQGQKRTRKTKTVTSGSALAPTQKTVKKRARKGNDSYMTLPGGGVSSVSLPSIPEERMEEITINPKNLINLDNIDPNDFKDCWVIDPSSNEPIYHPITNQPMLDYDKLKTRLTSEKYNFDLNEKRGMYIEKDVAKRYLTGMAKILGTALEAIPRRYTAQIVAECSEITGHQFSAEENARLRTILKNEAPAIMTSLQTEIAKMMDEAGEDA